MNNKTIIEFCFRIIWRIMKISKGVIDNTLLDLHNSSQDTRPHSLIVKHWHMNWTKLWSGNRSSEFRICTMPCPSEIYFNEKSHVLQCWRCSCATSLHKYRGLGIYFIKTFTSLVYKCNHSLVYFILMYILMLSFPKTRFLKHFKQWFTHSVRKRPVSDNQVFENISNFGMLYSYLFRLKKFHLVKTDIIPRVLRNLRPSRTKT